MAQLTMVTSVVLLAFCGSILASPVNNTTDGPECLTSDDCASDKTCIQHKCVDPCFDICGLNTVCLIVDLSPMCTCKSGFTGNPFAGCIPESKTECSRDDQCPLDRKCFNQQCVDPCEEACGVNSICRAVNHRHVCACKDGFSWNSLKGCQPHSLPDCNSNAHCADDRACLNQRCVDPCLGVCGNNTECMVKNHYPACACSPGYAGSPFDECKPQCGGHGGGGLSTIEEVATEATFHDELSLPKKSQVKSVKKFKIINTVLSWHLARKHCLSLNMNLVSIHSQEEQDRLEQEIRNSGIEGNLWTSGVRIQGVTTWISSGSHDFPYTYWRYDEPDIYICICLYDDILSSNLMYRWKTYACEDAQKFICEYYDT